jgi:hypothetical protein
MEEYEALLANHT